MAVRPITLAKVAIVAAGLAGVWAVLQMRPPRTGAEKIAFLGVILASAGAFWLADWYDHRERRRVLLEWLAGLGFVAGDPALHAQDVHYTPEKRHHSFAMRVFAEALWQGRLARVAEFQFETGRGKQRRTWRCFQAAIECPDQWPEFELLAVPRGLTGLMPERTYRRGVKSGDAAFDARWRIASADGAGTGALLAPELRAWLQNGTWRERWCVRHGWLSCTRLGACDVRQAERIMAKVAVFLSRAGPMAGVA
jgi:hypothetical protein